MTWLNPLALIGLLAVAVPVLVHLFGRRLARKQRFPSLRLLRIAVPSASTTSRPSDVLLLIVRCLVIMAATLALAQPAWFAAGRATPAITRVIIVDTSASMERQSTAGTRAIENARSLASALLDSAQHGLVIHTARPGANVAAAASWLVRHQGMRELVLISDFQLGALNDGDLSRVPVGIGIRPLRIDVAGRTATEDSLDGVRLALTERETHATWTFTSGDGSVLPMTVLHAAQDSASVRASIEAARSRLPKPVAERGVTLVFPGFAGMSQLTAQVKQLTVPWQGDFLIALGSHPLVQGLTDTPGSSACDIQGAGPVPDANGRIVAQVAAAPDGSGVVVFSCVRPGTTGAAALIAAIATATAPPIKQEELEPGVVPDETLDRWRRSPIGTGPGDIDGTTPQGRWLWLAALVLLLVEEWIRRRTPRRVVTATIPGRRADAA